MKKNVIYISGMHCKSCEMLIEENLAKIPEIEKTSANYKKGTIEIYYDLQKPDDSEVEEAIRAAGYSIGSSGRREIISKNPSDYKDLGIALIFLLGIYLIARSLGLTSINFSAGTGSPTSFSVILLIGLTAGFSTCMALVGGLVLGVSARYSEKHPEATAVQKFRPHLYFNLGRVLGFTLLGGILGMAGSYFQLSALTLGILTILVGLVMLLVGLQLIEIFPGLSGIKMTLPKFIGRALGIKNNEKKYSHGSTMLLGALTFFLPCGFTQAMQLFAVSTGSFIGGALVMGVFALGTLPGLLGIGGLTSVVKGIFAKRFFKFAGLLVIFFALFNISHGYNLTGWPIGPAVSRNTSASDPNVQLENGVQVVHMTQSAKGYSPDSFTVKKGIPVKWIIDGQQPYSCSSSLVMAKYNISRHLSAGENDIEFTPTETGQVKFSCSMGMYTGVFNVVDDGSNSINTNVNTNTNNPAQAQGLSGGTCGAAGGCGCGGANQKSVIPSQGQIQNNSKQEQVINTTFTLSSDIQPNTFTVKAGVPVKFIIDAKENGQGCMSTVMIPGLYNNAQTLQKGTVEMDFTPTKAGNYQITCAMGVPRGTLKVE